jgi:hypothetical protein
MMLADVALDPRLRGDDEGKSGDDEDLIGMLAHLVIPAKAGIQISKRRA